MRRLAQLVMLAPILPGWATSRWVLAQAVQHLDSTGRGRRALDVAVRARGGPEALRGRDELDARTKVLDHDWVFRQVHLYELGGLDHFVRRVASPDLVVGADRIQEWARTPMGGYQLERTSRTSAVWRDLATGADLETANLGASCFIEPGESVLGRLVPIEGGCMFESVPLVVTGDAASAVASDPSSWLDVVTQLHRSDDHSFTTDVHEFPLLTDVPTVLRYLVLSSATEPPAAGRGRNGGRRLTSDALLEEEVDLVLSAVVGRLDESAFMVDPWPLVAATLLQPDVLSLLTHRLDPRGPARLLALAERVTEPAAEACRWVAGELRNTA